MIFINTNKGNLVTKETDREGKKAFFSHLLICSPIIIFLLFGLLCSIAEGSIFFILVCGVFLVSIIKTIFGFLDFKGICGKCPICGAENHVDCDINNIRITCFSCKNKFGYHDGYFCKIDKNNKHFFQTEQEKTNELLKKTYKNTNFNQIKELKELLDMNAITEEEFEKKKKELL